MNKSNNILAGKDSTSLYSKYVKGKQSADYPSGKWNLNIINGRRLISHSGLALILILLYLLPVVSAQQLTARPDRGGNITGSYQTSNIDSVNMLNGNVMLSIPLASLPPIAGGKLSYTLNATYNSKLLNVNRHQGKGQLSDSPGCGESFTYDEATTSDAGGWKVGGTYQIIFRDAHEDYDYSSELSQACDGDEVTFMQGKFFKPVLRMPDGSEHELRFDDSYPTYTGNREHLKFYYKYTGTNFEPTFTSPIRMSTIDGTYLTVVYNPPTDPVKWTIYEKDGTQVIQNSSDNDQRIKDTNGNSILFHDGSIKDEQTGREIKTSQITYNGDTATKVEYQTVGGTWESVIVVWGTTSAQGKLYRTTDWNPTATSVDITHTCAVDRSFQNEFSVIRQIILPATESGVAPQQFSFAYNADTTESATTTNVQEACGSTNPSYTRTASIGFGELSQVTMPTGAQIKYSYSWDHTHDFVEFPPNLGQGAGANKMLRNVITKKELVHDGITDTWNYSIDNSELTSGGSVTNPDGSVESEGYYPNNAGFAGSFGGSTPLSGLNNGSNKSGKIKIDKTWNMVGTWVFGSISHAVAVNPLINTEFTTLLDDNGNLVKTKATKHQYDANGEPTQTIEYDWFDPQTPQAIPGNATVLRTTNNSYYNQADSTTSSNYYTRRNVGTPTAILGALQESTIGSSATRLSYDGQSYGIAPTNGNLTNIAKWDSFNNNWLNTGSTYDSYGNVVSTTDPKGNVTQIFYEDSTHVMPTKTIVDPQNGSGQQISTATYDFSTGAVLSQTDINGNVSNIDYTNLLLGTVDPFGRPGTALNPVINLNGTNKRQTVKTYYEDNVRKTRTETDLFDQGDGLLKARETRDQLGRAILAEKNEDGSANYTISSQTVFKNMGKIVLKSNPERSSSATTDGWTRVTNDDLGRMVETASFGGAAQPPWTGTNSNWTGSVTSSYDANTTTVMDQAGKQRRSVMDGIGQLVRVDEPDDSNNLGSLSSPTQSTSYSYDVLGNLTGVNQGIQTRAFTYDSLSRLRQAQNPESGTITYNYDNNGNLTTKTDARSIVTTYTYDAFNRVLTRSYSDGTPQVTYTYEDSNITFSKGKLTKVSSSVSETKYTSFDNLGKILTSQQITDGNAYNFGYSYNLSGAMVEENYPSGRKIKNSFQNDGGFGKIETEILGGSYATRADNFTYTAAGGISSMQLGNSKWENAQFNSRLQPTQLGLGTSATDQSLWKVNYDYGTTNNNGNVLGQTITVPTLSAILQTYTYDSLNRIKEATETVSSSTSWKQTFSYDRYGNRRFDTTGSNTTTIPGGCSTAQCNPTIDTANNRFTTGQGYTYDLTGNLLTDPQGKTFVYDAENKQQTVSDTGGTIGTYSYDGDGKRVKKVSASETTLFVYDASGKLNAEYLLTSGTPSTPTTSYLTNDTLGSPRVVTNSSGSVISRRDFMPFGEEISSLGGRTSTLGYQTDAIRQKFTGYERDSETDLDFAQARMYSNKLGRFSNSDIGPFTPADPQNFNRYAYVLNNPTKFVDTKGKELYLNGDAADDFLEFLGNKSGLELERDAKTGKISIKKGSKQNLQGTSKEFAKLIKNILGDSAKLTYDVVQNSLDNTLYDNGEKNVVNTNNKTLNGFVDFGDIKETDKQAPELAATITAHFLYEGLKLANGEPFTGDISNGLSSPDAGAHVNALVYETKILSDYTGKNEKLAERRDIDYMKNSTFNFIYTSVQYDIVIKSTSTNGITVDKITKTAPMRAPQYPPGP